MLTPDRAWDSSSEINRCRPTQQDKLCTRHRWGQLPPVGVLCLHSNVFAPPKLQPLLHVQNKPAPTQLYFKCVRSICCWCKSAAAAAGRMTVLELQAQGLSIL